MDHVLVADSLEGGETKRETKRETKSDSINEINGANNGKQWINNEYSYIKNLWKYI